MMNKDDLERRDAAWNHVARREGYACAVCGEIPPYGEREVHFETGLCGYHAYTLKKDDKPPPYNPPLQATERQAALPRMTTSI